MKVSRNFFYKITAIILTCALLINGNVLFNSSKVFAAHSDDAVDTADSDDPDLKLRYNTMAGTNFSGNAYDNNESYYKALPIGNGRLGIMAYGNYPDERFDLNEATFWSMGPGNNNKAGAADNMAQVKELMFNGDFRDATSLISSTMIGSLEAKYQSVGNLNLAFGHTSVSNYFRELDMNNAVVYCDYVYNGVSYHRESFVSFPDQVFVTKITADQPGAVSFTARYECSLTGQYTVSTPGSDTLVMDGHGDSGNGVNYASWFNTRTRIINTNGSVSADGSSLSVTNADSVVILTAIRTNFVDYKTTNGDRVGQANADIASASAKSYAELYNAHVADYQNLFKRVDVDLGGDGSNNNKPMAQRIAEFETNNDPKLAKVLFQYGRYLMISASRPGGQPMNLQGIWNKFRNPAWDSKLTTNINYEMNYWPALTTNLEECFQPFVDKAKALQGPGNETARVHYNIPNGWVVHHNTDLWNRTAPIDGAWGMWPTGAGWISNMLYDAYNFNQNTDYLGEIYPVIKGSADFLQTLMVSATNNGQNYQVILPGTSPELTPPSSSGGQGADCSYGVAMDNGISRELFKGVINASKKLDVDSEFSSILQSKVSQIQPSTIGSWGQIQEWFFDWDSKTEKNRHISHVYELFPGNEISKSRNAAVANAAITSLNVRGDEGTGWSEAWKLNCWARLEDGAHAYKLVKLLITPVNSNGRLYDNLWGAHPPFQIDGNFGFTSGITEMLLQSHDNEINLLPALPGQWPTGHANGLKARGNFEITKMNWSNGSLSSVTIKSDSGNVCNVRYGNNIISFPTVAGGTYQLNGSLQLIDNSATMSNVALNKMATASGNNSGEEASKAVDGLIDTKWCHDAGMSGEWLELDLGAEYDISRWVVKQAGLVEDNRFNTRDFTLQKSEDGNTWTDVDTVYGNVQDISDRNVPTFTARYVRLYINKATQDNSGGARIQEFELWGINEAESGILEGDAQIISDTEASGGRAVILSSIGDSVSFPNSGPASHITFRYYTENDPGKLSLYVDGMKTQNISFEYTGGLSGRYATQSVPVNIPSGSNFKLQLDSGDNATTIDSVTLMDLESKQTVKKLTVDIGDNLTLNVGGTATYKVTAEYYDGSTEDVTNKATYNNPLPEIAEVANGTITGKARGTTTVTVSYKGAMGDDVTTQISVTVKILNPYIQNEAEAYNQQSGVQNESCSEGGQNIGYIENGSWIKFNGVDFGTGAASFEARVSSQGSGGNIEIRLDSRTGPLVGTCPVPVTGSWTNWVTQSCEVTGATGVHDLYLRFTGGSGYLFNMNWWKFNPLELAPGVWLNKTSVSMKVGDTDTLIATVYPLDEPDKTVTYSSSNPAIATVTEQVYNPETGETSVTVNAVSEGIATITATTADGSKTATCTVAIISANELIVNGGFENGLSPWTAHDTANIAITNEFYNSGESSLAITGRTATGAGVQQYITGKVEVGNTYSFSAKVMYNAESAPATRQFMMSIQNGDWQTIENMGGATITKGQWGTIEGTYTIPETPALNQTRIFIETSWTSEQDPINDLMDFYVDDVSIIDITVPQSVAVTGVSLDNSSLSLIEGTTEQLIATLTPADATNKTVAFTSSNAEVATVTGTYYDSSTGTTSVTVNAIAEGNAVITATTADGNKTAECNVTVNPPVIKTPEAVLTADSSVKPGATFTVGIELNNLEQMVYAHDITLSYDSNVFEYVSAFGKDDNIQIVQEDKTTDGKVRFLVADIGGISGESTKTMNITFKVKAGVHSTAGTIAIIQAKLGVAPEGTVIDADLDSKSIAIEDAQPVINKTTLIAAINNAQGLYDTAVVGTQPGQYPQAAKAAFGAAIDAAKAVKDDSSATQSQVDSAVTALNSAVDTFKEAVIKEVSADINNDGIVDVADLAFVAYYYGKDSSSEDWEVAKIADINGDNKIDISDLAYVASKMPD